MKKRSKLIAEPAKPAQPAKPIEPTRRGFIKQLAAAAVVAPSAWAAMKYRDDHSGHPRMLRGDDHISELPEFINEHLRVIYEALGIKLEP